MNRYITVPAFKSRQDKIIPIWDSQIQYIPSEDDFSPVIRHKDHYGDLQLTTAIYNLREKTLTTGIPIDIFKPEDGQFVVGEEVYYDVQYKVLKQSSIVSISRGRGTLSITLGKDVESYYRQYIDNIVPDSLYAITTYTPKYTMADGAVVEWEHQIYKKAV